jgi:hypothetical protein
LYGVDSVSLTCEQVRKLSVAYNNAVRRYFGLSRFSSVRNVLYFVNSMPIKMSLDERRVLLYKDCMNCTGILSVFACLAISSCAFIDVCYKYDVHCGMSKTCVKSCVRESFYKSVHNDGLIL